MTSRTQSFKTKLIQHGSFEAEATCDGRLEETASFPPSISTFIGFAKVHRLRALSTSCFLSAALPTTGRLIRHCVLRFKTSGQPSMVHLLPIDISYLDKDVRNYCVPLPVVMARASFKGLADSRVTAFWSGINVRVAFGAPAQNRRWSIQVTQSALAGEKRIAKPCYHTTPRMEVSKEIRL